MCMVKWVTRKIETLVVWFLFVVILSNFGTLLTFQVKLKDETQF